VSSSGSHSAVLVVMVVVVAVVVILLMSSLGRVKISADKNSRRIALFLCFVLHNILKIVLLIDAFQ